MCRFHVSKEVTMLADPSNHRTGLAPACFDTKIFEVGWWPSVRHPDPSRMRQRMQSQAFVTDTSPSREYQVDFWRSRATYFAKAADQSFVQWKAEKKLNDGKVRHLVDELAGIKKSMSRMISPSLPCTRKIRRTRDTSNLFRTSSRRRLHDMVQLPMDSRHLHPLRHPRRSIQASTVATPHLNPNTQRTTLNEYPQSPLPSQPLLPQSRLSSLSQPGSESTGTQANLLKNRKRLLTLSSQTFLPSQHKRVHIRRLRQPQPCLRFRTTPLHVPTACSGWMIVYVLGCGIAGILRPRSKSERTGEVTVWLLLASEIEERRMLSGLVSRFAVEVFCALGYFPLDLSAFR
ncbi:hypothetical protein QC762_507755 [Podospora pseudocomata]|uniref:Uncharacterized protein n=1 Tax=Podospora pseudocomata TaxID=2093779 RepID=A0ABR0GCQ1_9PEZI|nr:hypothetical protein QC762_507755 [Podospora pseudocomata]